MFRLMCLASVEDTYKHNHALTWCTIYRHTCSHCRGQLHKTIMSLLDVPYVDTAQSWPASQSLDVRANLSVLAKAVSLHSGRTCLNVSVTLTMDAETSHSVGHLYMQIRLQVDTDV